MEDEKLRWQIFQKIATEYQEKSTIDMDELEIRLRREFGEEKTDQALDALLGVESDEIE